MKSSKKLSQSLKASNICLKWPLDLNVKLSQNLLKVENHWKDHVNFLMEKKGKTFKYILGMFPYPSGRLHMGHLRVYSISDVCARYYALNGYSVIHPIGWDGFGLPAENAAIQHKIDPDVWTYNNIDVMRDQLKKTGINFSWDREIFTCRSDYYKWTQWIFLQLYKHGLARRSFSEVFWDPIDKTVLADEQIDSEGRSWRSGAIAEKRKLRQWVIETPKYAKRLLKGLEVLNYDWGEVAEIQSNWIGKCDVFRFLLPIKKNGKFIEELFDLRLQNPTNLINTEFLIITSDHSLANKTKKEDTYLLDETVFNFLNGIEMPIVVIDCESEKTQLSLGKFFFINARLPDVLNFDFDAKLAQKFGFNSYKFSKKVVSIEQIQNDAMKNGYGGYLTSRNLRDWVVSRQRGWGTPIPMLLDFENCQLPLPVSESDLPIKLDQRGKKINCNRFPSGFGIYESDTLDTFFDSSWYFFRFLDSKNQKELAARSKIFNFMPIDVYVGGVEHADVHLFFARFISMFLTDIGIASKSEPIRRLIPQGIVRNKTFKLPNSDEYVKSDNVIEEPKESFCFKHKITGERLNVSFEKMSKSKMNGIDPLEVINIDGRDLTRLQLLVAAAPRQPINWGHTQSSDVRGLKRFIDRCAFIVNAYIDARLNSLINPNNPTTINEKVEQFCRDSRNECSRTISVALEVINVHNTAIEKLQIFTNALKKINIENAKHSIEFERAVHSLVIMLQLFAPHIASELWAALQTVPKIQPNFWLIDAPVSAQEWPKVDEDAIIDFLNGKTVKCAERRQLIENLDLDTLIDLAKNKYHVQFFQLLTEKQLEIKEIKLEKRLGMHVTLNIKLENELEDIILIEILHEIRKKKLSTLKKNSKKNLFI